MKKTALAGVALLLCISQAALGQELKTRGKLLKENAELRSQVDSLMLVLQDFQELRAFKDSVVTMSVEDFVETEPQKISYTPAETDSLLNLWYVHKQLESLMEVPEYDMDSVVFSSDVPDSVLMKRLENMNSFISLPFNETVKNYIVLYSEKMPTKMGHIMGLSSYYMPIFEETFNRYGLPEELKVMAVIESALNPTATSRAGAKGIWQFMHNTGKNYGLKINSFVDERMDVLKSVDAAARYLRDSYKIFGDWCLAIASYNCGPGNVNKAIKRVGGKQDFWSVYPYLPRETRGYLPAFVGALYAMTYYKEYGIVPDPVQMPAHTDTFEIHRNLHFDQISEVIGIPMEELKNLNPQYTHDIIPGNEGTYILTLPYTYTNLFIASEDSIYTHNANQLLTDSVVKDISESTSQERVAYKVKSGDYLGRIASRYGVTVKQIQQWNGLKGTNLRIGQTLYIYKNGAKAPASSKASSTARTTSSSKETSSTGTSSSSYTTYTVKSGDTLYDIAKKFSGVSANDIMKANGISSSIKPGMKLKIPN
ncbi:MAG: LysM peptidoglycan-binding domain-containing protein [Bacteroidia bacterium]|nr:LysM peptidoglycan-binding domain-containing protein [Bacteroidia bacterium]